jgi:predicted dehydrogenase
MSRIKVGIIGCGYWGPNLVRNFVEIPNAEVIGIADLQQERLVRIKQMYPHVLATQDFYELIDRGVEAVVIATPPATHYKIARECIDRGLHVLVEKPLTLNSAQAEDLITSAKAKQLTLMVGHTFEFNAGVQALKNLIDKGELGKILYIDAARLNLGLFQKDINVLWDLAPHDISTLIYILGQRPVAASAYGACCIAENIQDVVYLNLVFPGGVLAHVHVSWIDPCKVRQVTVVGSKKMAVFNDIESLEKIKIYDKGVDKQEYTNTFGEFQFAYRYGDIQIPNIRFTEPLKLECQHFLDSITNQTTPRTSGEEGLVVVKVLEAAQRSLVDSGHMEEIKW